MLEAELIRDVIGKTWEATDEDDLVEKISDETGYLINSIDAIKISQKKQKNQK